MSTGTPSGVGVFMNPPVFLKVGDDTLKMIAQELVKTIRNSVTIDWTEREAVRTQIRVAVKRILRRYGYPPDKQEKATQTVLKQAELLCADWAA